MIFLILVIKLVHGIDNVGRNVVKTCSIIWYFKYTLIYLRLIELDDQLYRKITIWYKKIDIIMRNKWYKE